MQRKTFELLSDFLGVGLDGKPKRLLKGTKITMDLFGSKPTHTELTEAGKKLGIKDGLSLLYRIKEEKK